MSKATGALFFAVISASLIGCGAFHNTLAQERVWAAEAVCNREVPDFRVTRVDPDGRYWIMTNDAASLPRAQRCMSREVQIWRGRESRPPVVSSIPTVSGAAEARAPLSEIQVPRWKVGDEWAYRYEGATGSGTYVWSVLRTQIMDGVDCYVIKTGEREIFYRSQDLALVRELVSGVVVRRDVPPRLHYQWPLIVGSRWQQELTSENWRDKQSTELKLSWEIVAEEDVRVPAGTFKTLKIMSRNEATNRPYYEMWYAPAVKQWVKIHEWRETGEQARELIAYQLR